MTHKSHELLESELLIAAQKVEVGSEYSHYKDPNVLYKVLGFTVIEATDNIAVRYAAVTEPEPEVAIEFVRPLSSWLGVVQYEGQVVRRFTKV